MIVFLIGMPACGKTSIGKRLAKKIQFNFIDLDKHLSAKENKSIIEIFYQHGEVFFRELETKYLKEISVTNSNIIISVGGGTPCYHNNIQFMFSVGKIFYLETSVETLFLRLKESAERPLFAWLTDDEMKNKIELLLQQREAYYLQAHYKINTAHKSDDSVVTEIAHTIKNFVR